MPESDDEQNYWVIGSYRKKETIRIIIDTLFWPSIVFGPCSLFLVIFTWNTSGVEGEWIPFVATPLFFIILALKIWVEKQ